MTKTEYETKARELIDRITLEATNLKPDDEYLEDDVEDLILLAGELSVLAGDMAEQAGKDEDDEQIS